MNDWHALGEAKVGTQPPQYRKWVLYELKINIAIMRDRIAGAPFGGPIASVTVPPGPEDAEFDGGAALPSPSALPDSSHLPSAASLLNTNPAELRIFNCAGELLGNEPIRVLARLVGM